MDHPITLEDLAWLRRLAHSLVSDVASADDAVQETLLAARKARVSSRGWLARVLRNAVKQEQRGQARRKTREERRALDLRKSSPAPDELLEELELQRLLMAEVSQLEEPYRETLLLRFVRDWTPRQIARHQDLPVKTVHTRIDRGLSRLRERLDRRAPRERWLPALAAMAQPRTTFPLPAASAGALAMSIQSKLILVGALALLAVPFFLERGESALDGLTGEGGAGEVEWAGAPVDRVSGGGMGRQGVEAAAAPVSPAPLVEAPGATELEGVVVDAEGGPVPGVAIVFEPKVGQAFGSAASGSSEPTPDDPVPRATSDAHGRFRMTLPEGRGRLNTAGGPWVALHRPYLRGGLPDDVPTMIVCAGRRYAGLVTDDEGSPVAHARVTVTLPGQFFVPMAIGDRVIPIRVPLAETTTSEDGAFEFLSVGFLPGALVQASRDGYSPGQAPLRAASILDLRLSLSKLERPVRSITGRVQDNRGLPVAGCLVSAGSESIATGKDGEFTLDVEDWRTEALVRAIDPVHGAAAVPLDPGALGRALAGEELRVLLPGPAQSIHGRVVAPNGAAVPGARVWTPDTSWFGSAPVRGERTMSAVGTLEAIAAGAAGPFSWVQETTADAAGRFELKGLSARSYDVFVADDQTLCASGPVQLTPGVGGVELTLELQATTEVSGVVVNGLGEPIAGVQVMCGRDLEWTRPRRAIDPWLGSPLMPPSATCGSSDRAVRTDELGRFSFDQLVLEGAWVALRGDEVFMPRRLNLEDAVDATNLRLAARERAEFHLTCRPDADAFTLRTGSDRQQPLFVPAEDSVISMGEVPLLGGRSMSVITGEGPATLVLLRKGEVLERREVVLHPGPQRLEL